MFTKILKCSLLAMGALCLSVQTYGAVDNGTYKIISVVSDKPAEVTSASTDDGANVVQWSDNGGNHQHWNITDRGDGFYSITNVNSGKAMEVYDWDDSDGANVVQYDYWGGDPQLWSITEHGNNVVSFVNKFSGKALDLYNFSTDDGANIAQWEYWGGDAQRWQLTAVGGGSSNPPPSDDGGSSTGNTNHWDLSGNLGTHDPTIIYEDGTWFLFHTGVGIYGKYSTDGLFWEPLPSVFPNGLSWWRNYVPDHDGTDVWAPELKQFNGRVWLYYSISTFGSKTSVIGLASATSVAAGNWRDDGHVINTTQADNFNAIDPDLVIDANGDPWLAFGSWNSGIKIMRVNSSTMKPTGSMHSIASRSGGSIEAPTIVYRGGYYYLFTSVGTCCAGVDSTYRIVYGRSSSITGPYVDKNGTNMMNGGGSVLDAGNDRWVGPGGQDISSDDVIARHAYDANDNGNPKLLISTLNWENGWPRY